MVIKEKLFCLNEKMQCIFSLLKTSSLKETAASAKRKCVYFEKSHGKFKLLLQAFTHLFM